MERYFRQAEELEQDPTLQNVFRLSCRKPENTFALWREDRVLRTMRYAEAQDQVIRAASAPAFRRLPPNSIVGLKLPNSSLWGILFWAVLMAGHRPVLMDAQADVQYDREVIRQAGAVALVAGDDIHGEVPVFTPEELLQGGGAVPQGPWGDEVLFCSSGTGGERSVQVYNGRNITAQILGARVMPEYSRDIMYPDEEGPLRNLALLPFHHIFGFVAIFLWFTFFQKTIVYSESLAPSAVLELSRTAGVTHLFCVPLLWNGIVTQLRRRAETEKFPVKTVLGLLVRATAEENPALYARRVRRIPNFLRRAVQRQLFGEQIRFLISGGSFIGPGTLRLINTLYPLYNGFGLTEAGIAFVELRRDIMDRVSGSIGIPLTGMEARLEGGTLRLRSPQLACGTMQKGVFVPKSGGWLDTGDMAKEEAGRIVIVGRQKEIIITPAGENVSPESVEAQLGSPEGIRTLCILGLRPEGGEETVCLLLEPEGELTAEVWGPVARRVREYNAAHPEPLRIRRIYEARQPIFRTNTLKIQRLPLREAIERGTFPLAELALPAEGEMLQYRVSPAVLAAVREEFARTLLRSVEDIAPEADFMVDLGGDSLEYAELIVNLERHFGVTVPPEAYASCMTPRAFGQLMGKLGVRL